MPSAAQCERLTREWLARIIERTALEHVAELPFSHLASLGPPLVKHIYGSLAADAESVPAIGAPAVTLARLRTGPDAPREIATDIASLQRVLIAELRRDHPDPAAFADSAERLADRFGTIQGEVARELVGELSPAASVDPITGLPGPAQLDELARRSGRRAAALRPSLRARAHRRRRARAGQRGLRARRPATGC